MVKIKFKVLLAEMLAYADDDKYILTSAETQAFQDAYRFFEEECFLEEDDEG